MLQAEPRQVRRRRQRSSSAVARLAAAATAAHDLSKLTNRLGLFCISVLVMAGANSAVLG
jgi:hypothetical protein